MWRPPLVWPLSQAIGARPAIMAACFLVQEPSSAKLASSVTAVRVPMPGIDVRMAQRLVSVAMKLAGRLHDDEGNVEVGEAALELPEPMARIGHAERLATWMHMDVEPLFTDVDADVDSSRSALFERDLALHTGLAPHHLF